MINYSDNNIRNQAVQDNEIAESERFVQRNDRADTALITGARRNPNPRGGLRSTSHVASVQESRTDSGRTRGFDNDRHPPAAPAA